MPFDLMQYIDDEIEESSGGGSFVCQISLGVGYLVYHTGQREDRYFEVSSEDDRDRQKKLAKDFANKVGKRSNFVVTLYMYADSVLNRDEIPDWKQAGPGVWGHDIAVWSDAYKKVLSPSITANLGDKPAFYEKHWAQVALVPDPYNEKSGKDNRVPQIVQIFESEDVARATVEEAGELTAATRLPSQPDGFDPEKLGQWSIFAQDVLDNLDQGGDGTDFLALPAGFGMKELALLKQYHEEISIPF